MCPMHQRPVLVLGGDMETAPLCSTPPGRRTTMRGQPDSQHLAEQYGVGVLGFWKYQLDAG